MNWNAAYFLSFIKKFRKFSVLIIHKESFLRQNLWYQNIHLHNGRNLYRRHYVYSCSLPSTHYKLVAVFDHQYLYQEGSIDMAGSLEDQLVVWLQEHHRKILGHIFHNWIHQCGQYISGTLQCLYHNFRSHLGLHCYYSCIFGRDEFHFLVCLLDLQSIHPHILRI